MNSLVLESEPSMPQRSASDPDPEVPLKARRRRFSASYKLRILEEADQCREPGEIGALLRREGLYSSLLSRWRRQREAGAEEALTPKKRGRKAKPVDPQARRVAELERENARLREKLEKAQTIIEVQNSSPSSWPIRTERPDAGHNPAGSQGRRPSRLLGSGAAESDLLPPPPPPAPVGPGAAEATPGTDTR